MSTSPIYFIGKGAEDSTEASMNSLGGKAFNLMRLANMGLSVPPAFVLGTEVCRSYFEEDERLPENFHTWLQVGLDWLHRTTGNRFGGPRRPLILSLRSGAPVSMPGMMETILNIGTNDATVQHLIGSTGNPRLAWDSYRRLIQQFAEVVYGAPAAPFQQVVEKYVQKEALLGPEELDTEALRVITHEFLDIFRSLTGRPFSQDPLEQLSLAAEAVLRSWGSSKAVEYRRQNKIDPKLGTAVIAQAMVFGNAGGRSGAGVGFTRNPSSGHDELYLDFLFNAQGEDVVSGRFAVSDSDGLAQMLPSVHEELERMRPILEKEFENVQDFEFTVQDGKLFFLQCREAKRTPWAALQFAVDFVEKGLIPPDEGLKQLNSYDLSRIERIRLIPNEDTVPIASAIPASIGVAVGTIAFDPTRAKQMSEAGQSVILVRENIETDDIDGIAKSDGILTATGARTSHAAVVARQLSKVCLVGCTALRTQPETRRCEIAGRSFTEGDYLSLDGDSGEIYPGQLEIWREKPNELLDQVESWREMSTSFE